MTRFPSLSLRNALPLILLACDGAEKATPDAEALAVDADADGFDAEEDCDDADGAVNPGASEVCDQLDNNCDGQVDEGVASTFYLDADSDGYGDEADAVEACEAPDGRVAEGGDCDDTDTDFHPGAPEDDCADPNDYNCDGSVGYADADSDGAAACEDCDDADAAAYPGAAEICDSIDNDCDDLVDADDEQDIEGASVWYTDSDGDSFGDEDGAILACSRPLGSADNGEDCDDASADIRPDADEVCDGLDNDCDDEADEDGALGSATVYDDDDSDGYGDAGDTRLACGVPSGYSADGTDCDDADAGANPGEKEVCDEADNDCDAAVDEDDAADAPAWYLDDDGDGYGVSGFDLVACDQPAGYAPFSDDCDDDDASVNPGEKDVCDEIDNDCDGAADEGGCGGTSCLALAADYAGVDGLYEIDPDGDGLDLVEVYCDMTTDGGGWTLIAWTGDSTVSPLGVPYPGLAVCPTQDCLRGSAAETAVLDALFQISGEVGIGHTVGSLVSYQNLGDYAYAGSYDYGSLAGFYLDPGNPISCDAAGFAAGTFRSFAGMAGYDGTAVYLAQSFRYYASSTYNNFDESQAYIWLPGAPSSYCNASGASPGAWLGNWSASEHEYGPYLGSSTGARAVWVR